MDNSATVASCGLLRTFLSFPFFLSFFGTLLAGSADYIRTFTWDKKLETMVKKSGLLGGLGKLPTIISPDEYKKRFIAAMHKYFIAVPDQWHNLGEGMN